MKGHTLRKKIEGNSLFLILVLVIYTFGCNKAPMPDPVACMTPSTSIVAQKQIIHFDNCSTNANSYQWDFGDGTSSTINAPSKSYENNGNYKVTLTALGNNSKQSIKSTNIFVGTPSFSKFVITSVKKFNSDTAVDNFSLELFAYAGNISEWGSISQNRVLPYTMLVDGKVLMLPGSLYFLRYTAFGSYQADLYFTPDLSSNVFHTTGSNSVETVNIDVYWDIR
jgi:PKD repeat protein